MATPQRNPAPHLDLLASLEPDSLEGTELRRLGFFGLVALLERLTPEAARVGGSSPSLEAIRFKHDPSLGFSSQDVSGLRSLTSPGRHVTMLQERPSHPWTRLRATGLRTMGS